MNGVAVYKTTEIDATTRIGESLSKGMYMVVIDTKEGTVTEKIVKQ